MSIKRVRFIFVFSFFIFLKCIGSEILKHSKFLIDFILSFPLIHFSSKHGLGKAGEGLETAGSEAILCNLNWLNK